MRRLALRKRTLAAAIALLIALPVSAIAAGAPAPAVKDGAAGVTRVILWGGVNDAILDSLTSVAPYDLVYKYEIIDGAAVAVRLEDVDSVIAFARANGFKAQRDSAIKASLDESTRTIHVKKAGQAWSLGYTGRGVTIAVLDTGVDASHWSLDDLDDDVNTDDPKVNGFRDFSVGGGTGIETPPRDQGLHGTHVAGIAAGTGEATSGDGPRGQGFVGVAYEANVFGVKVLTDAGTGLRSNSIAAINWVKNNANSVSPPIKVMTLSYGGGGTNNGNDPESLAIDAAVNSGIVATVAAGNGSDDGAAPNSVPGNINIPGDARNAITVCSSDSADPPSSATFSNWDSEGPTADGRIKPDVCAPGESVFSALANSQFNYVGLGGTSMATPHVAGVAALIKQAVPAITALQVKEVILDSASHAASPKDNNRGRGEVFAKEAIQLAISRYGGGGADLTPPSIVTGLAGTPGNASASLSWAPATDNIGVTSYVVYKDNVAATTSATTSATVGGLTNGVTYSFQISAKDAAGNEGPKSTAVTVTPASPPPPPPGGDWPQVRGNAARTGLNTGSTTMTAPQVLQTLPLTAGSSASPVVADLDADGDLDVVAVNDVTSAGGKLTVKAFRNSGSTLEEWWAYEIPVLATGGNPTNGIANLAIGDLNGSGGLEVVVYSNYLVNLQAATSNDGRVSVLNGSTGQLFGAITTAAGGPFIGLNAAPAIGDVTGDGKPDAIVIRQTGGAGAAAGYYAMNVNMTGTSVGVGSDTLIGTVAAVTAPAMAELRSAHAGLELVIATGSGSNTAGTVYLCSPTASSVACGESVATTTGLKGVSVADLNGDGTPEIVANGRTGNSLNVIKTSPPLALVSRADGFLWNTASLGDVDGDGKAEIVNVQYSEFADDTAKAGDVTVRGWNGAAIGVEGTLARPAALGSTTQSKGGGALVDLTGDGRPDLVFGTGDNTLTGVTFSTAGVPSQLWSTPVAATPNSTPAVADVSGDGRPDVLFTTTGGSLVVVGAPPVVVTPPGAPTGLSASATSGNVSLSWTAPASNGGAAITNHKVYRGTTSGSLSLLADTGSAGTTFDDTTVTNGTTYFYAVAAENSVGVGAQSGEASATPPTTSPAFDVDPDSLTFTGQDVGTTSAAQTLTVSNTGDAPLVIGTVTPTGDFATPSDGCTAAALAPAESCTVDVTFTPTNPGSRNGTLSITSNAAGSPHSVPLSGTGLGAAISLLPSSVAFGDQQIDTTSSARSVVVSNEGTADLNIGTASFGGANPGEFAISADTCSGQAVAPSGECTISMTFGPTATGAHSASLSIPSNAPGSPATAALSGNGVLPPALTATPSSISFGSVFIGGTSAATTVTVRNSGGGTLTVGTLSVGGTEAGDFLLSTNGCNGQSLVAGQSCTFNASFKPTATGARTAAVNIPSNASGSPHTVALDGTGTAGDPVGTMTPATVSFGGVIAGQIGPTKTLLLKNTGTGILAVGSVSLTGTDAAEFRKVSDACTGRSLAANTSCTMTVQFRPVSGGDKSAALSAATNAAASPSTAALTGAGLVDETAPETQFTTTDGSVVVTSAGRITGTVSDDVSGVSKVTLTFLATVGQETKVTASLSCNAAKTSCTWSATIPIGVAGPATIEAFGTDILGRVEDPPKSITVFIV